jgi:hypothetical protein
MTSSPSAGDLSLMRLLSGAVSPRPFDHLEVIWSAGWLQASLVGTGGGGAGFRLLVQVFTWSVLLQEYVNQAGQFPITCATH